MNGDDGPGKGPQHNGGHGFHLEIDSLEEFVAFCAVIRGQDLDAEKLQALSARLKDATKDLLNAEKVNSKTGG